MKIDIYPPISIHELGKRDNQEDAIYPLDGTAADRLFILCDGMGGYEGGELASQTVCQSLGQWISEHVIADSPFTDDLLREAIEYAYTQLDKLDESGLSQMGTTLTLIYIHRHGITAAHIGDSRIYHIRPRVGVLYQSRDHSLVYDLYQSGEITYEEMFTHPKKNIITRAMSPGEDYRMRPDIIHITDIRPNDYFFLCSDGMLENLSNDELTAYLTSTFSDDEKRQQLIKATVDNHDNHTAWMIHIKDVITEKGDETLVNEETTARCNAMNIKPKVSSESNVSKENDEDVSIKSFSPVVKKKSNHLKLIIAVLSCLLLIVVVSLFFLKDTYKEDLQRPQPMMQKPIIRELRRATSINSIKRDSNKIKRNDSTRNQQPIDAPHRNDSTRHLQN